MRTIAFAIVMTATLGVAGTLWAGRVGGSEYKKVFSVPSSKGNDLGEAEFVERFEGGKPAQVIVVGDHAPIADLEIFVYEIGSGGKEGKQVAHDGGPNLGDRVGVVWYPPRTADYKIVIRNPAPYSPNNKVNETQVSIR